MKAIEKMERPTELVLELVGLVQAAVVLTWGAGWDPRIVAAWSAVVMFGARWFSKWMDHRRNGWHSLRK